MLGSVKTIYRALPVVFRQATLLLPDRAVFGASFSKTKVTCETSVVQDELATVIRYVATNTDYGREQFPKDFDNREVMDVYASLPILDAEKVSADMPRFVAKGFGKLNSYLTTTGGTGGSPRQVRLSDSSYGVEWAHMLNIWGHCGYRRRQHRKLTLRGGHRQAMGLTEFNPIYNELVVNTCRLSSGNLSEVMARIKRHDITYIHGYPSLVKEFADILAESGAQLKVRGVFLGSEGASIELKKEIALQFGARVISWYGQTEKVVLAADFEGNNEFRVYTSYGYASTETADFSEILGTGFVNPAMPLVKYRTGDYGRIIQRDSGYYITDLEGRWGKDFVYLNSKKRIPTTAINLHSDIQREIIFYQIVQRQFAEVHVKILPRRTSKLSPVRIAEDIARQLEAKLSGFNVTTEIVRDESCIQRSQRGKMMLLVQEIRQ